MHCAHRGDSTASRPTPSASDVRRTQWIAFIVSGAFAWQSPARFYAFSKGSISTGKCSPCRGSVDAPGDGVCLAAYRPLVGPALGCRRSLPWLEDSLSARPLTTGGRLSAQSCSLIVPSPFPRGNRGRLARRWTTAGRARLCRKGYGGVATALARRFRSDVASGELVAIIGPNGARAKRRASIF